MNLATRLGGYFTNSVRKRCEEYHYRHRVRIKRGSECEMLARVLHASGAYDVKLNFSGNSLSAWCDCPHFVEHAVPCKHLWACILAADEQGFLSAAASTADPIFNCDAPDVAKRLQDGSDSFTPLQWDDGGPWNFGLELSRAETGEWTIGGVFRRGEEEIDLALPVLVMPGLVFTTNRVASLAKDTPIEWVSVLREKGSISAPEKEKDEFLAALLCSPNFPQLSTHHSRHRRREGPRIAQIQARSCFRHHQRRQQYDS